MDSLPTIFENQYITAIAIVIGAIIVAQIARFVLDQFVRFVVKRTRTQVDDAIFYIIRKPASFLIYWCGFYFAVRSLTIPASYVLWIERIFFAGIVLLFAVVLSRIASAAVGKWFRTEEERQRAPHLVKKIVAFAVYTVAILMILNTFGVEITPLIATMGIGGLAIGLALQSTLSNIFSGLYIISDKPVRVGDFIELPSNKLSGYVEDVGLRTTRIRTLPNTMIVVPNSVLAESILINNSLPESEMAALIECGVAYGSDLAKVEAVTIDVAKTVQASVQGAIREFEPFIRYHTFADSNINFSVILRVETFVDQYLIKHEFIKALAERYEQEGIEISWPVRKIVGVRG